MVYLLHAIPGPKERQSRTDHQTRLEDVVFNVFEDVNDSSANDLSGLYLKLNKKVDPGTYTYEISSSDSISFHMLECLYCVKISAINLA